MINYTGVEYLMIDCANAFGLDKELFSTRIQWVRDNLEILETLIMQAEEPILFVKAISVIRLAQKGSPTGHLVELDATTSGIQIMSAVTGCLQGATWTNLVDVTKRYDCYTEIHTAMLVALDGIICEVERAQAKNAVMCAFYGSSAEPSKEFGEETDELAAFYQVCQTKLPGAWELRTDLIELWQSYALSHSFSLPDGFTAEIKVIKETLKGCEIDELDHHKFTHLFKTNEGSEKGVSLAANVIHGIDGYVVREVSRRCNYDEDELIQFLSSAELYIAMEGIDMDGDYSLDKPVSLRYVDTPVYELEVGYLVRMVKLITKVLEYKSFEIICIHDAYKAHANNCNVLRYWYKELLAELAESDILSDMFSEITGEDEEYIPAKGGISKTEMAKLIRASEYAIC